MKMYSKKMLALLIGAMTVQSGIIAVSAKAGANTDETLSKTGYIEEIGTDLSDEELSLLKKGILRPDLKPVANSTVNSEPLYALPDDIEKGPYALVVIEKKLKKGDSLVLAKTENLNDGKYSTTGEMIEAWYRKIDEGLQNGPVLFCTDLTKENAEFLDLIISRDYNTVIVDTRNINRALSVSFTNDKDAYILKYGESVELGVTAEGGTGGYTYQWFRNGLAVKGAVSATYTATEVGKYNCRVTDRIGLRGTSKTVNIVSTLSFTKLPEDIHIVQGSSGTMSVEISGGLAPYTYQWYKDGAEIANSNSATCTVTEAGRYNCKVTDSLGQEITGRYGTVYITEKLALSTDLSEKEIMPASGVVLRVGATGGYGTYTYKWYSDGELCATTKASSIGTSAAGRYYCIVTDESGQSVQSRTCNVIEKLVISSQPQSQVIASGKTVTLSAAAIGGTAPYTYQWYKAGTAISGATSSKYNTSAAGSYYCIIKDSSGQSVSTNTASITVASAITISSQTQNYPVLSSNNTAALSVTATGGYGTLTYQWYKSGTLISGATKSTYTATAEGTYYCTVKDSIAQLKSTNNIIVVKKLAISSQSGSVTINSGSSATMTVTPTGGKGPYKYQWYKSGGTAINGATSYMYTTSAAGTYYCKITDQSNQTVYSSNKTVTVLTYRITSQPQSGVIASDNGYKLSVGVTGGKTPYKYTWRKDGGYVGNEAKITVYEPGKYCCTIVDADGKTLTSDTVTLTKNYLRFTNTFPTYAAREGNYYHLSAKAAGGSGNYYYYYWQKMAAGTNEWVYTDCHDSDLYVYAGTSKGDIYRCCITCERSYEPGYAYLWGPRVYIADPMQLKTSYSFGSSTGILSVKGSDGFGPYTVKWYKRTAEDKYNYTSAKLVSSYKTSEISNISYTVHKSSTTSGKYKEEYYAGYYSGWKTRYVDNGDLYTCEITDATGTTVKTAEFSVYRSYFI